MTIEEKYSIPQKRESDFIEQGSLFLYMPRANKAKTMLIGDCDSSVALCTGWNDPELVVPPKDIERFSIIAPLRSLAGVDIMLWNLAANPHIQHVFFWAGGKLDETERAARPKEVLFSLWKNGVDDSGIVKGADYQLNKALVENGAINTIRKMVRCVDLVDWSKIRMAQIEEKLDKLPKKKPAVYMKPVKLPEFKVEDVETLPSEGMSFLIREKRAVDAWIRLLDRIVRYGKNTVLETEQGTMVRELQIAHVVIENDKDEDLFPVPSWLKKIEQLGLTKGEFEKYYKQYFCPDPYLHKLYPGVFKFIRPKEDKYLYCELIYAFPRSGEIDTTAEFILKKEGVMAVRAYLESVFGADDAKKTKLAQKVVKDKKLTDEQKTEILLEVFRPPTNQVAGVIERIKKIPDDADKTFVLWNPDTHGRQYSGRPCLLDLSLLVRNGKINCRAIFRSHDIAKGWLKNVFGIYRFLQEVCRITKYKVGKIEIESESAHFYLGDQDWVKEIWQKQVADKKIPKLFNEENADPRGNFGIEVIDREIVCNLLSPKEGKPLLELRGKTALEIIRQLDWYQLISQPTHGLDIGMELSKAETCLKLKIPYIQDRSLVLKESEEIYAKNETNEST